MRFVVPGQPLPKARPRIGKNGAYTPQKTLAYENTIGWCVRAEMADFEPLRGDIGIKLDFYRKGRRRADLDNMIKSVLDGLNGILFEGDKQVCRLVASVVYGSKQPRVEIEVI